MLFEQQAKEMQEISARWISDNKGVGCQETKRGGCIVFDCFNCA
ncbi:MAG: hypothetical protein CM15mV88_190 [Caudoviricetes sp.]|nr:MAG: hypothetical protein CM15mV88_190 [Caudoviricetes sp.]